jgi:hypothetical protein
MEKRTKITLAKIKNLEKLYETSMLKAKKYSNRISELQRKLDS